MWTFLYLKPKLSNYKQWEQPIKNADKVNGVLPHVGDVGQKSSENTKIMYPIIQKTLFELRNTLTLDASNWHENFLN